MSIIDKIIGTHSQRELRRISGTVDAIEAMQPKMQALSDEELRAKTDEFKKIIIDEHKKAEYNDAAFTSKLVEKLSPSTNSPLDKVRVAYAFARLISANDVTLNLSVNDEYISYLVNAINHVCLTVPDGD